MPLGRKRLVDMHVNIEFIRDGLSTHAGLNRAAAMAVLLPDVQGETLKIAAVAMAAAKARLLVIFFPIVYPYKVCWPLTKASVCDPVPLLTSLTNHPAGMLADNWPLTS